MRILFAPKNTKAFCKNCNAHLFTFNKNTYTDDRASSYDVTFAIGQEPEYNGEMMTCKKCYTHYSPGFINLEKPNHEMLQ